MLITAVAAAVAAVLIVVLGGWVWPGWWTTTDAPSGHSTQPGPFPPASVPAVPPTASTLPPTGGNSADGTGQADQTTAKGTAILLVAALQRGDLNGIMRLTCAAGLKPYKNGPQDRAAVVDDLINQIPPWNPDRPDLVVVRMKFTLADVVTGPAADEAGAQVKLTFDNVPPAAQSDPKVGPLMVNHTGAVTLIKSEAGKWENCKLNLGPPKSDG